jgi:hypothetical protein
LARAGTVLGPGIRRGFDLFPKTLHVVGDLVVTAHPKQPLRRPQRFERFVAFSRVCENGSDDEVQVVAIGGVLQQKA